MGTRADFYIGTDPETMEYLGSISYDGYKADEVAPKDGADYTEEVYRRLVSTFLESREDGSLPERDGWPWPWEDSGTSDRAYTWSDGKLLTATGFPEKRWFEYPLVWDEDEENYDGFGESTVARFPNMKSIQKVTFGSRSGVLVLGVG